MKNLPWLGPDIPRMAAAFAAAFIPPKFKTVCGWCGCFLYGDALATPENVSHGICKSCLAEQEKLLDESENKNGHL